MNPDKELLELAAKAAGVEAVIYENDHGEIESSWNPLKYDGDALRLAVKLQLAVEFNRRMGGARAISNMDNSLAKEHWCNTSDGVDSYKATCRAIVLAAAEIGRSMK